MFTGIIQNQAKVIRKKSAGRLIHFVFHFMKPETRKVELGESIAVDGVCLTVAKAAANGFEADVVHETLKATTLSQRKPGSVVNTERALRYGDSMGGHFVTGHVDARSRILSIEKRGKNLLYTFQIPSGLAPYIAAKGSVVIDGISLTVQAVNGAAFKIAVIPHTAKATILRRKVKGNEVNLEIDLIARYLRRAEEFSRSLAKRSKNKINEDP